jgi:predicted MFS family arabinose efflux permease
MESSNLSPRLADAASAPAVAPGRLTANHWRSGLAAWLGWTFDGLDMHLYTLVAAPFVAQLLGGLSTTDPRVGRYGSIIQGAFLLGWAVGGAFFGRLGDRLGRARALSLTMLTYAACTGLSYLATAWWHLLIFRFVAALGIGGEWALGASLVAETWPRHWRPWLAAVLQTGVNVGILAAGLANFVLASAPPRCLFLVGIVPATVVFWIRRRVPEPAEWVEASERSGRRQPRLRELFRGEVLGVTVWVTVVCALSLTAHWAFLFWHQQQLRNLPEVLPWSAAAKNRLASAAMYLVIGSSVAGNFLAAAVARRFGYRATIAALFAGYFLAMLGAYAVPRNHVALLWWLPFIGLFQGAFALFTMYLPPLFPTLLRTTGAGFCFNIGRVTAAFGTVFFGLVSEVGDHRSALFYSSFLFLPAALAALFLPSRRD